MLNIHKTKDTMNTLYLNLTTAKEIYLQNCYVINYY